jgi:hypothetical protein
MAERTFTLEEAQNLLPVLESLLRASIEGKQLIETVDEEFQALSQRILLAGGSSLNIVQLARRGGTRKGRPESEGRPRRN